MREDAWKWRVWGGGSGCVEVGGGGQCGCEHGCGGGVVWGGRVYLFSCLPESMTLPWVMGMVISRIHFTTRWYICACVLVSTLTYTGLRCLELYCIHCWSPLKSSNFNGHDLM